VGNNSFSYKLKNELLGQKLQKIKLLAKANVSPDREERDSILTRIKHTQWPFVARDYVYLFCIFKSSAVRIDNS
jgi:hypothetical protein